MKKKAIISVLSKQADFGEDNDIEVVTPGEFYKKDDCYYAVYTETKISGMEGTTTTMKIYPTTFSLIRMGTTTTKMDFKEKTEGLVLYNTPHGILELKIETKDLKINIDDKGGEISIDYNMSVSGQPPMHTVLKVNINAQ